MSPRTPKPRADALPDGEPGSIVRRAPFADSPFVGARGQKAQARILDAALQVFGEVGYHGCSIKRITEVSGCSRASFYQYFSSKEDLFRHLAGRVATELSASAEAVEPITADQAGWDALHAWLERYAAIYDRYEPVFATFDTAVASDAMVASGSSVVAKRTFATLRSRISRSVLTSRQIDVVVGTIVQTVARLNRETELLERVAPDTALNRARANQAYADAFHRTLFGPIPQVNVHGGKRVKARSARSAPEPPADDGGGSHGPTALQTRAELLAAGHRVFVERGYYATRVVDVVQAAKVSHGVFYRYFDSKAHLFRILAERASNQLGDALDGFPDLDGRDADDVTAELRSWLRRYANTYAEEAAIFAMWNEAITRDEDLGEASAAVIDGGRARIARRLRGRAWGDTDADALLVIVLLDAMTSRRTTVGIDATAELIERGLLTGPG